jgi:hypothetical protein
MKGKQMKMTRVVLMMSMDTPQPIKELGEQIMDLLNNSSADTSERGIACLYVTCAYLAAIDDEATRDMVIESLSEMAANIVRENRELGGGAIERQQ